MRTTSELSPDAGLPTSSSASEVSPDGSEAQFAALGASFEQAAAGPAGPPEEFCFDFAGKPARVRLVGRRLADSIPLAWSHLRVPHRPPVRREFTIELWDEAATGVGCVGCQPSPDLEAPGTTAVSESGRYVVTGFAQTRTGFDRIRQRIVGWIGNAERLTQYEVGRPIHSELLLWHRDRGLQALHAGLVGEGGEGILLGGPGGSGKSTTALSCLQAGMAYLSDDYVALDPNAGDLPICHSVYCSSHVEPAHLERFPGLRPYARPGLLRREDKSLLLLSDLPGALLESSVRLRAIAFPRVVDAPRTTFQPIPRGQAMLRLAPSSLMLLPFPEALAEGFKVLTDVLNRVPVYWLDLGRDLAQIPEAVRALLRTAKS